MPSFLSIWRQKLARAGRVVKTMMRVPTTSAGLPITVAARPAQTAEDKWTGSPSCCA